MSSNHLTLCLPRLLLPSIFPSIRVLSNELALHIKWPKYWRFSFSINAGNEYSGLISLRIDWFDLAVQGTLKSLLQHRLSKASILQHSAFFMVQPSHPYMTTGKIIALTRRTFVSRVMSLLFNTLSRFVIAFLPRRRHLLISWLQSVILEPKKIKSVTVSIFSPSICHEVVGLDALILVLWMLSLGGLVEPSQFYSWGNWGYKTRPETSPLISEPETLSTAHDAGGWVSSGRAGRSKRGGFVFAGLMFRWLLWRPVFPLVNIQPPALSSLEWNVKLQMGEQSAPWLPGTAGEALWIFQRAGTVPRGLINCSGLPRYTTPFLPYSTRAAHLPPPHLSWSWKPGLAYLSISQLPATHLVHGRKEGNLAWVSGVWVLLTAQQCFALGSFWGSQIPDVFESHLQPYDESTVVHLILQMTKQNLGEVKRLLGDLYSTRVVEFKTRLPWLHAGPPL